MTNLADHPSLPLLLAMLQEGSGIQVDESDVESTFFELGLDSLFLTQFSMSLSNRFGVPITFRRLSTDLNSLSRLAAFLEQNTAQQQPAALPQPAAPIAPPAAEVQSLASAAPATSTVALPATELAGVIGLFKGQLDILQQQLDALARLVPATHSTEPTQPTVQSPTSADVERAATAAAHPIEPERSPPPGGTSPGALSPIPRRHREGSHGAPLSKAQEALWFLDRLLGPSDLYNIGHAQLLTGALDLDALKQALADLVARHAGLRTMISEHEQAPVQIVLPDVPFGVDVVDVPGSSSSEREEALNRMLGEEAARPFDLSAAPLFRARILRLEKDRHVLQMVVHHIISDGWSLGIMMRDLAGLYQARTGLAQGGTLPDLPIEFEDFATWQRQRLSGAELERQLAYWKSKVAAIEPLELPSDRPRPSELTFRGGLARFSIDARVAGGLREMARRENATLFMVLLAAFKTLLMRYSGQENIAIGTPYSGREHPDTENVVGYFVNMLVLHTDLGGNPGFRELLAKVRQETLEAYEHHEMPFDLLVASLNLPPDLSRNPLFQVSFSLNNQPIPVLSLPAVETTLLPTPRHVSQFDLSLTLTEKAGALEGEFEYSSDLFDEATVLRMAEHFNVLLEGILQDPTRRIALLPLLTGRDRVRMLETWNATDVEYPKDKCLPQLIEEQVRRTPDKVAAIHGPRQVTYSELNASANRIAHYLRDIGVEPEQRVGVCIQRGFEMLAAMLGVMKAGGAYVPLDEGGPKERVAFMMSDAGIRVVLTDSATRQELFVDDETFSGIRFVCLDTEAQALARFPATNPEPAAGPGNLVYVIYTSGSTGKPKGVMIEHGGLTNNICWQMREFGLTPTDRYLSHTPIIFDAAVWELWTPMCVGVTQVIADKVQARDPALMLELMRREAITHVFMVPSFFTAFLTELEMQPEPPLAVRFMAVGGEALHPHDARRWYRLSNAPLVNSYGPTETTIDATLHRLGAGESDVMPIGKPMANTQLYILDTFMQPVPIGVAGELYIGGDGVARGYLNRPELTAERFVRNPFGAPGSRIYRTGDLCRFLPDGNVEYLGRTDYQVKIRGNRIQLEEVEAILNAVPGVEAAAAKAVPGPDGTLRLAAYVVPPTVDPAVLKSSMQTQLPDYMVPSVFVPMTSLPHLPNGKLDRKALPLPEFASREPRQVEEPQGDVEVALARVWAGVLGIGSVGRHDNFFELGGHSLLAVTMVQAARKAGLGVTVRAVFNHPTLSDLAREIAATSHSEQRSQEFTAPESLIPEGCKDITPAMLPLVELSQDDIERIVQTVPGGAGNIQDIYPLAPLQEGILYHHRLQTEGDAYILRSVLTFEAEESMQRFLAALQTVIDRHDALRTSVLWEGLPRPVQVVHREARLPVSFCELSGEPAMDHLLRTTDPKRLRLDLAHAPLVRAYIARDPDGPWHVALLDHHIIGDHISLEVIMAEVRTLLGDRAATMPPPVQYRRFVAEALAEQWDRHKSFFSRMLEDVTEGTTPFEVVDVAASESMAVAEEVRRLPTELGRRLRNAAAGQGVSTATIFHLAWALVLGRFCGKDDVVFGTVLLGRSYEFDGIDRIVGLCMNTLPIRIPLADRSVKRAVVETFRQLGELIAHEQAPLSLAQRCSSVAAPAPLFTTLLNFRHTREEPGQQTAPFIRSYADEQTNYPFSAFVDDYGDEFALTTQAIDAVSPVRLMGYFERAVASIVDALERDAMVSVLELDIMPAEERQLLVATWNDTAMSYPMDECMHHAFESQAARQPDAVAVTFQDRQLTYGALNRRANKLARVLRGRGAARGRLVGLCVERSDDMLVAMLAILKSGAAYVPLDPAYPPERLQFMATDASLVALVTEAALGEILPWPRDKTVLLDFDAAIVAGQPDDALPASADDAQPTDPAYVIYTSGSTGKPKGVVVPHRPAVNLLCSMAREPGLSASDKMLAVTTLSFDISVVELMLPLSVGAEVVLASRAEAGDGLALRALLERSQANVMDATPATWRMLVASGWQGSPGFTAMTGGEPLALDLALELKARTGALWNLYGPTETTVYATGSLVRDPESGITIGKPIANTTIHVLDPLGRLCPPGVAGEIHIGGAGVAIGYLNRPELTAEKFVEDRLSTGGQGGRLYRTGDRGRWVNGEVEHLGRLDFQIKVRGFRIEPGEIESSLVAHPAVSRSVVMAREDRPGDVRLVAYIVPRSEAPSAADLREHLRATLPEYMVPQHFVVIDAIPLLPNGKTNRAALPKPSSTASRPSEAGDAALQTPTERLLARIWSELLGTEGITADDNFFSLGGHSLLAMQVVTQVQKLTGKRLDQRRLVLESLAQIAGALDATEAPAQPARQTGIMQRLLGKLKK